MPTITHGSENIASLDSKIFADTCSGFFHVDVTPTVFIGSGADNVLGARIKIINPLGVVIKAHPSSGYDISGDFTGIVDVPMPTEAGSYQFGQYEVAVTMYDLSGESWTETKAVNLTSINQNSPRKKYAVIGASISGLCSSGKAVIQVNALPNYRGAIVESQDNSFELIYPGGSGIPNLDTTQGSFSVVLYEGEYKVQGETCATYNLGNNIYVSIKYKLNYTKKIYCVLNQECIAIKLSALQDKRLSDCSHTEQIKTDEEILRIVGLVKTIEMLASANQDVSDYVRDLEEAVGGSCSCEELIGVPIFNNTPSTDILIQGFGINKTTVGLTDIYEFDIFQYVVEPNDNGGALTITASALHNGVMKQTVVFNIGIVYAQIKELANTVIGEDDFWAAVINKTLDDTVSDYLGVDEAEWLGLTFGERIQAIVDKLNGVQVSNGDNGITRVAPSIDNDFVEIFELGGELKKDTVLSGLFELYIADGTLRVDNGTGLGGAPETGFPLKIVGNSRIEGQASSVPQALTYGVTTSWDLNGGTNAAVTLTGNATLAMSNMIAGTYGTLKVTQDGVGGRTLALPIESKVRDGGGGAIVLSATATAVDIICYYYDGVNLFWTKGLNYT